MLSHVLFSPCNNTKRLYHCPHIIDNTMKKLGSKPDLSDLKAHLGLTEGMKTYFSEIVLNRPRLSSVLQKSHTPVNLDFRSLLHL